MNNEKMIDNKIIIAIDIIDGKCVRLSEGNFNKKKIYSNNPVDVALFLENNGINRLHLVDLDGARTGKVVHWKILENISKKTKLSIDFGGGICKEDDIKKVFEYGGNFATIGSIAVKSPFLLKKWICKYGNDKILLGIDIKNNCIAIDGWKKLVNIPILNFIKEKYADGVKKIFCTDISKDGLLKGPSFHLYKRIINSIPKMRLIGSGGIKKIEDIKKLLELGCSGVIIGKAIYENKISLSDLFKFFKLKK